jgi:predicted DNA-binding transcriptional regulator YafY
MHNRRILGLEDFPMKLDRLLAITRAIQKILSYGSQVTVTEPPELIKELQRHIQKMAELYKL